MTKVGTATFEDKSLVGEGYLPDQGMPSIELVAGKEVKKSFFLKVWVESLCQLCQRKTLIITVELCSAFSLPQLYRKIDSILTPIDTKRQTTPVICLFV